MGGLAFRLPWFSLKCSQQGIRQGWLTFRVGPGSPAGLCASTTLTVSMGFQAQVAPSWRPWQRGYHPVLGRGCCGGSTPSKTTPLGQGFGQVRRVGCLPQASYLNDTSKLEIIQKSHNEQNIEFQVTAESDPELAQPCLACHALILALVPIKLYLQKGQAAGSSLTVYFHCYVLY